MVPVVVNKQNRSIRNGQFTVQLKTPSDTREGLQCALHALVIDLQFTRYCNRSQCIEHVVTAREIQHHSQRLMFILVDVKMHLHPILTEIHGTDVGVFRLDTIGPHLAGNLGKYITHIGVIQAQHGQPVEWQVVQKLHESLAQALEITFIGRQMIGVDIGYNRQHRLQIQE